MPSKYAGLRDLLRPCMEGVNDPFSDAGEHVVYMRFYATAQSVLTDHLIGPESVSDTLIEEILECAFYGLYDKVRKEAEDQ